MNVRRVVGKERHLLRRPREPFYTGANRRLDFDEMREMKHLRLTRQATIAQLAERYGVSTRTVMRYTDEYPEANEAERAAHRLSVEADRIGLTLTRDDALRLAAAALTERAA